MASSFREKPRAPSSAAETCSGQDHGEQHFGNFRCPHGPLSTALLFQTTPSLVNHIQQSLLPVTPRNLSHAQGMEDHPEGGGPYIAHVFRALIRIQ